MHITTHVCLNSHTYTYKHTNAKLDKKIYSVDSVTGDNKNTAVFTNMQERNEIGRLSSGS